MAQDPNVYGTHAMGMQITQSAQERREQYDALRRLMQTEGPDALQRAIEVMQGWPTGQSPTKVRSFGALAGAVHEQTEWHKALLKVLEYLDAQSKMHLFGDDKRAQTIFETIMLEGLERVLGRK